MTAQQIQSLINWSDHNSRWRRHMGIQQGETVVHTWFRRTAFWGRETRRPELRYFASNSREKATKKTSGRWEAIDARRLPICISWSDLTKDSYLRALQRHRPTSRLPNTYIYLSSVCDAVKRQQQQQLGLSKTIQPSLCKWQSTWLRMQVSVNIWHSDIRIQLKAEHGETF